MKYGTSKIKMNEGLISRKRWSDERWETKDWYEHKDLGIRDKDIYRGQKDI